MDKDMRGALDRLSLLWAVEIHSSKHAFKYRLRNLRWPPIPQATSDLFVLKMLSAD